MILIGVDTATDRWHACHGDGPGDFAECKLPHSRKADKERWGNPDVRRHALCDSFRSYLWLVVNDQPARIFCEEPLALQNGKTTRLLGLAAGALWREHAFFDAYWFWTSNSTWGKYVGIKGNMKSEERKAVAKAWAIERGAPEDLDEDHYDAFCIRRHGIEVLSQVATPTTV